MVGVVGCARLSGGPAYVQECTAATLRSVESVVKGAPGLCRMSAPTKRINYAPTVA